MKIAWLAAAALMGMAQDGKKEELRKQLKDAELGGAWIYDDVDAGFAEAKRSGKPLLVAFR